ncbi:endonuclease SmrB [Providencia rustigianii]|nr:endonuclease SmrB [Providencia rustigianii]MTC59332.1 endonuclease SmrB [Providencia rustigianii]
MKKNKFGLEEDDLNLFKEAIRGAKKIRQDKIVHSPVRTKVTQPSSKKVMQEQVDASFYFSDEFQPQLDDDGPTRYLRPDSNPYELKKLRRGDYVPELFLDLHGLTQMEAKQEIGALIAACKRENVFCACIMHGHGKHILKQQTPLWLAQHPDIVAFHQAPKEWGGNASLLLIIETAESARR